MKKCDLDSKAFWTAVYRDDPELLQSLLKGGINPNETFPLGAKSPFHGLIRPIIAASQSGSLKNIEILLDHGADITGENKYFTAISQAAHFEKYDAVELLKRKGAKHNIFSYTACGTIKQVEKFLNKTKNPETMKDEVGNSVFHYATATLQDDILKQLLKSGINVDIQNNCKESAIHIISNLRICDYSLQAKVLKRILKAGALVNEKDWNNVSALHKAVRARSVTAVKLLIKYGADVNAIDNRGSTPLRRAVTNTGAGNTKGRINESLEIAHELLKAGSNPKAKSKDGKIILDAVRNKEMKKLVQSFI